MPACDVGQCQRAHAGLRPCEMSEDEDEDEGEDSDTSDPDATPLYEPEGGKTDG